MRSPGRVQFSGQHTARSSNPSHPQGAQSFKRLVGFIPFILPQIGLVADWRKLDFGRWTLEYEQNSILGV